MILGTVEEILLNDRNPNDINKVVVSLQQGRTTVLADAYPLNLNIKSIPIKGEQLYLVSANSPTANTNALGRNKYYYLNPVGLHNNINHNSIPNLNRRDRVNTSVDIGNASIGIPTSFGGDSIVDLGNGFEEVSSLSSIQPFLGDVIIEGRFGHSIRMGYTPNTNDTTKNPTWQSSDNSSPITIIRNGGGFTNGYNKFTIEDINDDDSSIYLTSKQILGLDIPNNKIPIGIKPISEYSNPQIVLNSDRVVINSKSDGVVIRGGKSVYIITEEWKADMNVMMNQIKELHSQISSLTSALTEFTTLLNSTPAAPAATPLTNRLPDIVTKIQSIGVQLQRMQ